MKTTAKTDPTTLELEPVAGLAGEKLISANVEDISPHPNNPRRIDDKHPSLPGLAESIKATGLINPITVMEDEKNGGFLILAGERRWRAHRLAGLPSILCRLVKVTEEQAFHILTIENLQREDLTWQEEARGVELMLKRKMSAEAIAHAIGRSVGWVALRERLCQLSPKWIKFLNSADAEFLPLNRLELVARFPVEVQDKIHERRHFLLQDSFKEFQTWLDGEYLHTIAKAPWDINDATLVPKAKACSACPKRSSCQQQIFGESTAAKDDRCTDAKCWSEKQMAWLGKSVKEKLVEQPKALLIQTEYDTKLPAGMGKKAERDYGYQAAKEGAKGAIPVIYVDGPKVGQAGWMKKESYGGGSSQQAKAAGPKPAKERLAIFMKRRHVQEIVAVIEKLGGHDSGGHWEKAKPAPKGLTRPSHPVLISLALSFGINGGDEWSEYEKTLTLSDEVREQLLWDEVRRQVLQELQGDANSGNSSDGAKAICKACSLDWKAIVAEVKDKLPLPRTLAEIYNEDGTPKKGLAKSAKKAKA